MDMTSMDHGMNASHDSTSSDTMAGMSMSTIFSTSTHITLFFTGWTTTTIAAYIMTIIFLFILALFNRFIGALKHQIESVWSGEHQESKPLPLPPKTRLARHFFKAKTSPLPLSLAREGDYEWDPLTSQSHTEHMDTSSADMEEKVGRFSLSFSLTRKPFQWWKPSKPWNWKVDGVRAIMEFTRAFIGYILMLAVMTFNLGIFLAVLGGVFIGELIFGRYSGVGGGWQEGACHD